jgi:hypothetical protein
LFEGAAGVVIESGSRFARIPTHAMEPHEWGTRFMQGWHFVEKQILHLGRDDSFEIRLIEADFRNGQTSLQRDFQG